MNIKHFYKNKLNFYISNKRVLPTFNAQYAIQVPGVVDATHGLTVPQQNPLNSMVLT